MQSFAVGGLRLVLAAGVLRMCQYLTVLPSVAKELWVLRKHAERWGKATTSNKIYKLKFYYFFNFFDAHALRTLSKFCFTKTHNLQLYIIIIHISIFNHILIKHSFSFGVHINNIFYKSSFWKYIFCHFHVLIIISFIIIFKISLRSP